MIKIYLDTNVVIALAIDDSPGEYGPIVTILDRQGRGEAEVVTSPLTATEIDGRRGRATEAERETYEALRKVPTVDPQKLLGITHGDGAGGTWWNSPILENDPVWQKLRDIGVKDVDAQHLLAAIKSGCDTFLTCDRGVLRRAQQIASTHGMSCIRPSGLVTKLGW